jgi:sortase B
MMTLVHGHNMKEGAMFGSLKKYKVKDASYYKEHPFVTFDTLYEKATYVIFAVAEVNIVPGNTHYFPFWHQFSFGTKESFEHFVLLAKEYSRFKVDIDVAPGDRLLTLATCSSDDSNLRLIVMARMLRENEDKIMLSNKIYSATAK